ncbi:MAG: hypothetical protein RL095_1443 [Verrucomicrobiota bacterium]
MKKSQGKSVQHEAGDATFLPSPVEIVIAIEPIAKEGVAEAGEMTSDLMETTSLGNDFDKGKMAGIGQSETLPGGDASDQAIRLLVTSTHHVVDQTRFPRVATADGEIGLGSAPLLELSSKPGLGGRIQGKQDDS